MTCTDPQLRASRILKRLQQPGVLAASVCYDRHGVNYLSDGENDRTLALVSKTIDILDETEQDVQNLRVSIDSMALSIIAIKMDSGHAVIAMRAGHPFMKSVLRCVRRAWGHAERGRRSLQEQKERDTA